MSLLVSMVTYIPNTILFSSDVGLLGCHTLSYYLSHFIVPSVFSLSRSFSLTPPSAAVAIASAIAPALESFSHSLSHSFIVLSHFATVPLSAHSPSRTKPPSRRCRRGLEGEESGMKAVNNLSFVKAANYSLFLYNHKKLTNTVNHSPLSLKWWILHRISFSPRHAGTHMAKRKLYLYIKIWRV